MSIGTSCKDSAMLESEGEETSMAAAALSSTPGGELVDGCAGSVSGRGGG